MHEVAGEAEVDAGVVSSMPDERPWMESSKDGEAAIWWNR
jgi:hypothetical protein